MTPSERKRLEACLREASEILYNISDTESITTLEDIETIVTEQVLENFIWFDHFFRHFKHS